MRTQSPWPTLALAAILLGFALWFFRTDYVPPDSTPLHLVDGSIRNVSTTWIHHSSKGGGWNAPVQTITTSNGGLIRFTAHAGDESPAVLSMGGLLEQGSALRAQVDASGEIWELSANESIAPISC